MILTFSGNLGADPETRETRSGTVTNFRVAASEGDEATWLRVAAWGKLGEICNRYLSKGRSVTVVGRLKAGVYEGKPSLDVTAIDVKFFGKGTGNESPF